MMTITAVPDQKHYGKNAPWRETYRREDIVIKHKAADDGDKLVFIVPGFHSEEFSAKKLFEESRVFMEGGTRYADEITRILVNHIINSGLFPYPTEELA